MPDNFGGKMKIPNILRIGLNFMGKWVIQEAWN